MARFVSRERSWPRRWGYLTSAVLTVQLLGCVSVHVHNDDHARRHGFERVEVRGEGFAHVAYVKMAGTGDVWHVYLEGDGLPWTARVFISPDPAVREPLMLQRMTEDPAPVIYLGRPCYHGTEQAEGCEPWVWTSGRHAEAVVASQVAALRRLIARYAIRQVSLIGHSGGGAFAMLMAPRELPVVAVMTVAGNLDLAAWTRLHDYSPLTGSLDPAAEPPLPTHIAQLHFAGAGDENVPPRLVAPVVQRQSCAQWTVFDGVTHVDGWAAHWPAMLAALRRAEAQGGCASR